MNSGGTMNKYFKITNLVKRNSDEKVTSAIFGERLNNVFIILLVFFVMNDVISTVVLYIYGAVYFWILEILVLILMVFYLTTQHVGIGITKNRIVYVKVSRLFYKAKEVDDIPIDKIRNITVNKILGCNFVKMTFINDIGRLKKISFSFNTRVFGVGSFDFKIDSKKIYDRLKEVEKVIDKGDF